VVKGEVCKTSIQRFESVRRLQKNPEDRKAFLVGGFLPATANFSLFRYSTGTMTDTKNEVRIGSFGYTSRKDWDPPEARRALELLEPWTGHLILPKILEQASRQSGSTGRYADVLVTEVQPNGPPVLPGIRQMEALAWVRMWGMGPGIRQDDPWRPRKANTKAEPSDGHQLGRYHDQKKKTGCGDTEEEGIERNEAGGILFVSRL
jgi:hypothetical protein